MAEEEEDQTTDESQEDKKDSGKEKSKNSKASKGGGGILMKVIMGVVIVALGGGAGLGAAIVMDGEPSAETAEDDDEEEGDAPAGGGLDGDEYEYYEFEPLTVNLNVQQQDRYVRATVLLGITKKNNEKATALLEKNKIFLKNWLMTYLAGHTLDQVKGRKNLVRIQREICESFNQQLWPNRKPRIDHVLFKEFAIQ